MMNSSEIESLVNLTLEIEGLLMLVRRRDEMTPSEVYDLLSFKASRLSLGVDRLNRSVFENVVEPDNEPNPFPSEEPAPAASEEEEDAEIAAAVDFEESNDAEPFNEPQPSDEPAPADEPKGGKEITLTLNDKFRFRRSIFDGSDARMAEALAALSAIHDRAEIEDYIANDLCRDLDDPEVQDFIAIIEAAR